MRRQLTAGANRPSAWRKRHRRPTRRPIETSVLLTVPRRLPQPRSLAVPLSASRRREARTRRPVNRARGA